ncbi:MAG: ferrous iron transport protein A [Desulfitobacterium sp.]|nr:ferrous iron transport protein A [Desulfitobacterium sp.]
MDSQDITSLSRLKKGEKAYVVDLGLKGLMRRRVLDLGIVPGTILQCVAMAPSGDPVAYLVRGTVIAIRNEDANFIQVRAT